MEAPAEKAESRQAITTRQELQATGVCVLMTDREGDEICGLWVRDPTTAL